MGAELRRKVGARWGGTAVTAGVSRPATSRVRSPLVTLMDLSYACKSHGLDL